MPVRIDQMTGEVVSPMTENPPSAAPPSPSGSEAELRRMRELREHCEQRERRVRAD